MKHMSVSELLEVIGNFPNKAIMLNTPESGLVAISTVSILFPEDLVVLEAAGANQDYDSQRIDS